MAGHYIGDAYSDSYLYPYRYFSFYPPSGTYSVNDKVTITLELELLDSSWSGYVSSVDSIWLGFFDSSYNSMGYSSDYDTFITTDINDKTVNVNIDLAQCSSSLKTSASYFSLHGVASVVTSVVDGVQNARSQIPLSDSNKEEPLFDLIHGPTITAQPSITSMNPTSGQSTTIEWSAAQVINLGNATIYYQYFVGPSSTYSDSYHVGTTTSTSATIAKENIIEKCGSSFSGTCYIFVRAYWDNGSENGGWCIPTAKSFTYDPVTLSNPGNAVVSQSAQNFVVSWSAATGSGGGGNVTYVVAYGDEGDVYDAGTATNATIPIHSSYWGKTVRFRIWAYYSGKTTVSEEYTYITPKETSVTIPSILAVTQSGSWFHISWEASTGSYGTGDVTYKVIYGDSINGYEAYYQDVGTNTSSAIAQWITPYGSDVTCQFKVKAIYSGVSNVSSAVSRTLAAPVLSWANKKLTVTQVGTQAMVSWNAATIQNGSATITYYLYCDSDADGVKWSGTGTEATITPNHYDTDSSFYIYASCDIAPGVWSETVYKTIYSPRISTPPGKPTITQSGSQFQITWSAAVGSYGTGDVTYKVFLLTDGVFSTDYLNSTSATLNVPLYDSDLEYLIIAYYSGVESLSEATRVQFTNPYPTITAQPVITSMIPESGTSTTITWSAAQVSNLGDATIYYQYLVGPSSTYSDSYHAGITTSTSATITEANILSNCGTSFSGTCYIFVRAYWDNGSANGGWYYPTGRAFVYTPHRTIKYYVNSAWVECIPYYCTGGSWVECIPYYYDGTSWKECGH